MEIELAELRNRIAEQLAQGAAGALVKDVNIETDTDEYGSEFLRVLINLTPTDRNIDSELESILERIEELVGPIDDRYPSVRFLDAA